MPVDMWATPHHHATSSGCRNRGGSSPRSSKEPITRSSSSTLQPLLYWQHRGPRNFAQGPWTQFVIQMKVVNRMKPLGQQLNHVPCVLNFVLLQILVSSSWVFVFPLWRAEFSLTSGLQSSIKKTHTEKTAKLLFSAVHASLFVIIVCLFRFWPHLVLRS